MLGNGLCTRRAEMDRRTESEYETCAYFCIGAEFLPILVRQREQADRADLLDGFITWIKGQAS